MCVKSNFTWVKVCMETVSVSGSDSVKIVTRLTLALFSTLNNNAKAYLTLINFNKFGFVEGCITLINSTNNKYRVYLDWIIYSINKLIHIPYILFKK